MSPSNQWLLILLDISHQLPEGQKTHGHTPEHLVSTATASDISPHMPIPRPNEPVEQLKARLVYQSRKRGTLESDLLLSTFARDNLATMNEAELKEYDKV